MRARYDAVIADLNKHRDSMSNDMVSALTRSADKLEDLESQLRELRLALK
jgi:outer membrane protein TolC